MTSALSTSPSLPSLPGSPGPRRFPNLAFEPPTEYETPESLFNLRDNPWQNNQERYIRRGNNSQILLRTGAASIEEDTLYQRAGWAFTCGSLSVRNRLEDRGPTSETVPPSLRRAALRAVVAVLQYKNWGSEGFKSLVVTTSSRYVFTGLTIMMPHWVHSGWANCGGYPPADGDLWESIFELLVQFEEMKVEVLFWEVPHVWNLVTDMLALNAANMERVWFYRPILHGE